MARRRYTAEQIIGFLRQVKVMVGCGMVGVRACIALHDF